ncbi:hypothetical protein EIN_212840 [Entamoeba invadens IP1]|uniref:Uncharacterized protein n=1 Tax=Entamoeba invadens IP1 TaxID=370355 RepID=A0A0A1TZL0_ENTIV|nr:hypothetical protein EIN_212840 [Entamoeba invadens IP1]ELP84074.1 hypothetical protein EIN_212840 [Entamoeba invadens IP1]|eukprot:XP_004183420.1 hypothetical protein EIN_212840 [Entamoeba invadens IP1]
MDTTQMECFNNVDFTDFDSNETASSCTGPVSTYGHTFKNCLFSSKKFPEMETRTMDDFDFIPTSKIIPEGKHYKTPLKRLNYLRERKIMGRNEESQIIDGLQYLLVARHNAVFYYVKEKRSKKTIKFRVPKSMELNGVKADLEDLCKIGEVWLIDNGFCSRCAEKNESQKRLQRSKESEMNGALISILNSLGYSFQFKKLKDKINRKTTPFVKIQTINYPDGETHQVEEIKKFGKLYDQIMMKQNTEV